MGLASHPDRARVAPTVSRHKRTNKLAIFLCDRHLLLTCTRTWQKILVLFLFVPPMDASLLRPHRRLVLQMRKAAEVQGILCTDVAILVTEYAQEGYFHTKQHRPATSKISAWCVRDHEFIMAYASRTKNHQLLVVKGAKTPLRLEVVLDSQTSRVRFLSPLADGSLFVLCDDGHIINRHMTCHVVYRDGRLPTVWAHWWTGEWWGEEACFLRGPSGKQELAIPHEKGIVLFDPHTGVNLGVLALSLDLRLYYITSVSDDRLLLHLARMETKTTPRYAMYSRASGQTTPWALHVHAGVPVVIPHLRVVHFFALSCCAGRATALDLDTQAVLRTWDAPLRCGYPTEEHLEHTCLTSVDATCSTDPSTGIAYKRTDSLAMGIEWHACLP